MQQVIFSIVSLYIIISAHLEDVAPGVVLVAPAEAPEHLEDFLALQDAEQTVQEDLEADGESLAAVQHQGGDVEGHVRLDGLHGTLAEHVAEPELVQGWNIQ